MLAPIGIIGLGIAMFEAPQFGKGVGRLSVGLGALGIFAAASLLVTVSPIAIVTVFSLIAFHLVIGWKLSRSTSASGVQSDHVRSDAGALVDTR